MNNQSQAQPVAEKSEFQTRVREHLDWGRGYNDLNEQDRRELTGHYICVEITGVEINDLFADIGELEASQIVKMLGIYATNGSPSARDAALQGLDHCFGKTLKDTICQAFEFALEEMRHEDAERGRDIVRSEEC